MCVLLVEDEPLILEIMQESLQDAGYLVMTARTGAEAASLIYDAPIPFTILVTDLHMPGALDGAGVALLARRNWPDVPVIIASGRPDALEKSWREDFGYTLVKKPYGVRQMLDLVGSLAGPPSRPS